MTTPRWRLILNGKSAGNDELRDAVGHWRGQGVQLEVRVTWEDGDAERYVAEAIDHGVDVIVAAGGDGTLSAVAETLAHREEPADALPSLALIPMGTANDFATAAGIPTEPKVRGTRWLDEDEFSQLYKWLECPDVPVHPPYLRAVRILMLTGQRVEEMARLHVDQWDAEERILDWSKTKNGKPHSLPVPDLAADLLESIKPNEHGWFFPSAMDPTRPVSAGTLYAFMWRQRGRGVIPVVTNRDLRRTWKTLAGKAGIPKEIRDRLQNHTLQDVSSKHYDRWQYMPEKRKGMKKWNAFVSALLASKERKMAA